MSQTTVVEKDGNGSSFNSIWTNNGSGGLNPQTTLVDGSGAVIAASNPLPTTMPSASLTDRSGTITSGGTAQTLMASNSSRKGWWVQNTSSGDLWINEIGGAAVVGGSSIRLTPGSLYEPPVLATYAISIIGATTGQTFAGREW